MKNMPPWSINASLAMFDTSQINEINGHLKFQPWIGVEYCAITPSNKLPYAAIYQAKPCAYN